MVREVLFPQAWGEELDLQGGMGIHPLQHIDQRDIGIDALETTGREHTLEDADLARADFRPTEPPVFPTQRPGPRSLFLFLTEVDDASPISRCGAFVPFTVMHMARFDFTLL